MRIHFFVSIFAVSLTRIAHAADDPANPVSDDAIKTMREVEAAYTGLQTLHVRGTESFAIEQRGHIHTDSKKFEGLFASPNKFRLETEEDLLDPALKSVAKSPAPEVFGCNGTVVYFDRQNHTLRGAADVPKNKQFDRDAFIIGRYSQCPPIEYSMRPESALRVVFVAHADQVEVKMGPDVRIGEALCHAVIRTTPSERETLVIDADSKMVRRIVHESLSTMMKTTRTIDFAETTVNGNIDPARFAWSAPAEWSNSATTVPTTQPQAQAPAVP